MFHSTNSLVVYRNLWFILKTNIWLFLSWVKKWPNFFSNSQDIKSVLILLFASVLVELLKNCDFQKIKVSKHNLNPCCHLATKTDCWNILITTFLFQIMYFSWYQVLYTCFKYIVYSFFPTRAQCYKTILLL